MRDTLPNTLVFKTRNTPVTTVQLPSADLAAISTLLSAKMAQVPPGFFTASPFIADLGAHVPGDSAWLRALKKIFAEHKLTLIGIQAEQADDNAIAAAGLARINPLPAKADPGEHGKSAAPAPTPAHTTPAPTQTAADTAPQTAPAGKRTMVVKRHVRSGQRLYAEGSDLVIIGMVGAGAEVIADGHIFVLGSLRGRAFAGAHGDESAFVFAAELAAELVSVAGQYQNMEQLEPYNGQKNMLIRLGAQETMQIAPV